MILLLNHYLVQQRLFASRLHWVTTALLLLFWATIGYATWRYAGGSRVWAGWIVGIVAAATEETLFRGIIFGQLVQRWRLWPALLGSGLLFGAMHLINLTHQGGFVTGMQVLQAAAMGVMLAAMYMRAGSLLAPMVFHFSLDFCAVAIHGLSGTPAAATPSHLMLAGTLIWAMLYLGAAVVILYGSRKPWQLPAKLAKS